MKFIVVIPARYESSRLPGKPLLDIGGKPMLHHVVERARSSSAAAVYVATDDERICRSLQQYGDQVVMTGSDHQSGTDRIQEVVSKLDLAEDTIVVNVQGDEPLIPPEVIDQVATDLAFHRDARICTLFEPFKSEPDVLDPNHVKVITDREGYALYFSRAVIPFARDSVLNPADHKRHVGIYAYRAGVLNDFVSWPHSALEQSEKLEQLRALSHGIRIHVQQACAAIPAGVDTQADLEQVRALLAC